MSQLLEYVFKRLNVSTCTCILYVHYCATVGNQPCGQLQYIAIAKSHKTE